MTMRREIPLGFSPERCLEGVHLCCVYRDAEERQSLVARYLRAGLEAGEKLVYAWPDGTSVADVEGLAPYGFDPKEAGRSLQLGALVVEGERYEDSLPAAMVEQLVAFHHAAKREGHVGVRAVLEMTSTMLSGADRAFEQLAFEMLLSDRLKQIPVSTCCLYDASRLSGGALMDVLTVHPLIIVRSQLLHSPYFVEADQFMSELRERRAVPHAPA